MANGTEPSATDGKRFAWLRLNSYGVILAGLCVLSAGQILRPETSAVAQITGVVPALFPVWQFGYVVAGVSLLWGFISSDRFPEVLGLVLLNASLAMSTVSAFIYLGWDTPLGEARLLVLILVAICSGLRLSALISKHGLTITIPPTRTTTRENEQAQQGRREAGP